MDEYLGTIKAFAFNFPPRGWQLCQGQIVSIAQNTALFSLIGTYYGGNGQTTFALPDLRGRSIVHPGQGPGLSPISLGEVGGVENVTLTINNLPAHNHALVSGSGSGQVAVATTINALNGGTITNDCDNGSNSFASGGATANMYSEPGGTPSAVGGITTTINGATGLAGNSNPIGIRNPYLGVNMSICVSGIFPPRD
ncbi:phage tail protein [Flavobacterium sp. KACC 22761]|uniref:phage tail protein n=1 Tax=Flavobacterium sp. KACC 22761 TaxID=3092665 RepID=UPI002A74FCBE|nr:tail fiber protein [Flavobacterium sp. KACC 22761]WPO78344.1 tail fiber protein [Flavobacterium sp. KACC 22761]